MILSELIDRVKISSKYKVAIKINLSYSQLLEITGEKEEAAQNSDDVK